MTQPKTKSIVSGVLLIDKPQGMTSQQVVSKVKYLLKSDVHDSKKAGHTGTLDPMATGLLPICLGEATKFSHYQLDAIKSYQAIIKLGEQTDTGDAEGQIIATIPVPHVTQAMLQSVTEQFLGEIMQVPPMYSALKKDGKKLYELAREGIEVERTARPLTIYKLSLTPLSAQQLQLTVTCSKGTYVRVLAEDIAKALGTYGHLTYLHRIKTGHFDLIPSYTIEYLESLSEAERDALLLPAYAPVDHFPKVQVPESRAEYFSRGMESNIEHEAAEQVLVFDGEKCLGLAEITDKKRLVPKRVLNL